MSEVDIESIGPNQGLGIDELIEESYSYSKDNGFHDREDTTFGDRIALIHSEVSETLEEFRAGHGFNEIYYKKLYDPTSGLHFQGDKPEGIPIELADTVIRIADLCGLYGIDLENAILVKQKYNRTRPYRHGKAQL